MRRIQWALCLATGATLAILGGAPLRAQEGAPAQPLPLRDVVLFSSGVGYFQREGRIQGRTTVPLSFRADQVNDILKSLVLLDPAGGVQPVTYNLQDSSTSRLFRVGESLNPSISLGALLRQFQGAQVRLELAGEAVEGRIVSVSTRNVPVKIAPPEPAVVQQDVVNVLTETGLRAVALESVTQVRLLDQRLDKELRESLERLARGLDDQRQSVQLEFNGGDARTVKAGYLQEMPVWKTSYRLVLDPGQKPYLQGWAIVENPTDEDWQGVRLSLVSGRPISFIQDLYQPLYVPRPVVQAQVIGSPLPQTYSETLDFQAPAGGMAGGRPGLAAPAPPPAAELQERRSMMGKSAARMPRVSGGGQLGMRAEDAAQSVATKAEGTDRGALFEYAIKGAVTIQKGKAAMVPIVTAPIAGEAVSIYDPTSDPKRALNGFRLKNDTGMHLSGGPITVFQEGGYSGDAQITNLQPNEDRILSYAVDLELVADREEPKLRQETLDVVARSGVLLITRKHQRENVYTFRNKSEKPKTVLVLQDQEEGFKLAQPAKPFETTPEEYRFRLEVPAGKTAELKVVTERPVTESVALLNADLNLLISWSQNGQISERLRGALKQLITHRQRITDLQAQRAALEAEIKTIDQEQARIRQNMMQLDRNSPLYQQYVKKLTEQETRIEKLREEIVRLREAETAAQKELQAFVDGLTVEK